MENYDEIDSMIETLDWETPIEDTGDGNKPIPPGRYPFRVIKAERAIWDHGKNMNCKYMDLTLELTLPDGETATLYDKLTLARPLLFRIRQFWRAVGANVVAGQAFVPDWDAIVGQEGTVEIEEREYTGRDGTVKKSPNVKSYLEPSDSPKTDLLSF